jgi:predicted dehydrogenase
METMKRYRAVVVGCGKVGATFEMDSGLVKPASHAAAFAANPRTELVGLVEPDEAALTRATAYYRVPGYADVGKALVELAPDIVVIATPPQTHEELLTLALEHNVRAVVCEKPVSDSLEGAERMIKQAKAAGSLVVVNHQRRFFPLFKEIRERIAAGEFGRIQQGSCYYSNGLQNNGTHTIDALCFLLGDIPAWAVGIENTLNKTAPFGSNIDGMVGFGKGAVVTLQSLDNAEFGAHDFVLLGTKGAVTIRQYGFRTEVVEAREGVTFAGMRELDWDMSSKKVERRSMLVGTVEHLIECLDGTAKPQSTLEDGYKVMQTLSALEKSASQGGVRVTI